VGVVDCFADATEAVSSAAGDPEPSSSRPIAKTSATAVTSTIDRRNQ
jgi:hypothetical protein